MQDKMGGGTSRTTREAISETEMGQIALKVVRHKFARSPLPAPKDFQRQMTNLAKDIGVEPDKFMSFLFGLMPEMLGKMFGVSAVGITTRSSS